MALDTSIYNPILNMPQWGAQLGNSVNQGFQLGQAIQQAPMRNRLLEAQTQGTELSNQAAQQGLDMNTQKMQIQDLAMDWAKIKPALESGDMQRANVLIDERINKIQNRGGDPSDTIQFRDQLNSGKFKPMALSQEIDASLNEARNMGWLGDGGMTDYQRQNLELQRMRLEAQNGDPSAVKEYKYFQSLNEDQKREYLKTKRAGSYFDKGDVRMVADPLSNTAQPVVEAGTSQTTQADIQSELTGQQAVKAASEEAAKTAIKKSEEAFDRIEPIKQNIANYDEVVRLIDEGANTGVIQSRLPSFKQASQELDNLQGRLGLDVIQSTTFGALSAPELKFALDTALPKNLEGPALKSWVQRKKTSQQKLLGYLQQAATYLGTPGNTVSGWVSMQRQNALDRVPPQAIEYLRSNPDLSDQFMDKYGVLPDGF